MKNHVFLAAGLAALLSTSALAGEVPSVEDIESLENKEEVTISGIVDSVENEREFTLRDAVGEKIGVDISSNESLALKKGDAITVSGTVDRDISGTDINAHTVSVSKPLVKGLKDAIRSVPGISTTDAQAFNISDLPSEGRVKVTGTVAEVDNEKEFTLRDKTGTVNVDVVSTQNAVVTKGAEVTVIGSIDSGAFGKDINATEVLIVENSKVSANH